MTMPAAPLFRAPFRRIGAYGSSRGLAVGPEDVALGSSTLATVALLALGRVGWLLLAVGRQRSGSPSGRPICGRAHWLAAFFGGLRFRFGAGAGPLTAGGLVLTHFVFALPVRVRPRPSDAAALGSS